jgi:hypothetical protein
MSPAMSLTVSIKGKMFHDHEFHPFKVQRQILYKTESRTPHSPEPGLN